MQNMKNENTTYDKIGIREFHWSPILKSLIFPLIWILSGCIFLYFIKRHNSEVINVKEIISFIVLTVFILYLPNIILFCQYFMDNHNLKYRIDYGESIIEITKGDQMKRFAFEDVMVSKIYKANYKRWNFNANELFYRDFGYWYINVKTNDDYRITSLLTNIDNMPMIPGTNIVFVAFPNFKKEQLDYQNDFRREVNSWKKRFKDLGEDELIQKWKIGKQLDQHAAQAIKEMMEKSD